MDLNNRFTEPHLGGNSGEGCLATIVQAVLFFGLPLYIFPAKEYGGWFSERQGIALLVWIVNILVFGYRLASGKKE